jgi:transposase
MRRPALIKPWISPEEMMIWVREAPSRDAYQKRLAVWLTHVGPFHAGEVADMLCVSKQAVWLWIGQYNRRGPEGLRRQGRGGRRWSYLGWAQEQTLLHSLEERARAGEIITAKQIVPEIESLVGGEVSKGYVYKLLRRHHWRKLGPRPRHVKANPQAQEEFKKNSPASSKKR